MWLRGASAHLPVKHAVVVDDVVVGLALLKALQFARKGQALGRGWEVVKREGEIDRERERESAQRATTYETIFSVQSLCSSSKSCGTVRYARRDVVRSR